MKGALRSARPKRMLEVMERKGDVPIVFINPSSLDLIQTCPRKAQYALRDRLRSEVEGEALVFGQAIHAALAVFYGEIPGVGRESCLDRMVAAFEAHLLDFPLDPSGARTLENGRKILKTYFETYLRDPWVTLVDKLGEPILEREMELPLTTTDRAEIVLFGTLDIALHNVQTGQVVIADHKTSSRLGQEFVNRVKPNHQFSAYILLAQKVLGLPVHEFMVNGIQVAKTKCDLPRIFTERSADDLMEFRDVVVDAVHRYLDWLWQDRFPLGPVNSCSMWSGCQYREVCSTPPGMRQTVISNLYPARDEVALA